MLTCTRRVICIATCLIKLQLQSKKDITYYRVLDFPYSYFSCLHRNDFVVTTSVDGHLKFWKKTATGIEFVKHYKSHLSSIVDISLSADNELLATISTDMSLKVYDITNFGKRKKRQMVLILAELTYLLKRHD